ncbi:MAG: response regulator transcription factor [Caldilineae bacterium]|nr:response regulator transcription factor [Chloroflexota bacterium]MCB9177413.1 response regulator transcription factor [Caldilineae bacterium]
MALRVGSARATALGVDVTTVLLVDDSASLRALVGDYLGAAGMRVVGVENGRVALEVARRERPDIVLLDLMMPQMDGLAFLEAFRAEHDTPVIVLSARLEEADKVLGLELGADDYLTKPFGMRELSARIQARLRRARSAPPRDAVLRLGEVSLDRAARTVHRGRRELSLTPTEFEILDALMSEAGRVLSRAQLQERLQGPAATGSERTVDVHVRNLRAKLEPDPAHPRFVETVFGQGYRFRVDRG